MKSVTLFRLFLLSATTLTAAEQQIPLISLSLRLRKKYWLAVYVFLGVTRFT
jgi:hypothetical protein